jgi:hydrogenase/urease accessory protein HupE
VTRTLATLWLAICVLLPLCIAQTANAHAIDAATLTLAEQAPGRFHVQFQAGSQALQKELLVPAIFPRPCRLQGSLLECGSAGLSGEIQFPWLNGTLTRLQVVIERQSGEHLLRVVTASSPVLTVYGISSTRWGAAKAVLADHVLLGIEHILRGFDHLCFVLALLVLVQSRTKLFATITAFTLAHSLTLALTALGLVQVPTAPVEALIALSIVHVCVECLRPSTGLTSQTSLTSRAPWLVAFSFGLLHGLGFASALLEVGLPDRHLGLALFGFNLGVEFGQIGVVLVVSGVLVLGAKLGLARPWVRTTAVYLMGSIAAHWSLDRLFSIFG